jgi:hypothetical protein
MPNPEQNVERKAISFHELARWCSYNTSDLCRFNNWKKCSATECLRWRKLEKVEVLSC